MALVNMPVPEPSVVFEFAVVGLCAAPQHTPRAVIGDPPSFVIFPPLLADIEIIAVASVVVKTGAKAGVVKDIWLL